MSRASLAALSAVLIAAGTPVASGPIRAQLTAEAVAPRDMTAVIDGVRFHYYVLGDLSSGRTPVLLLHGAFDSAEGMLDLGRRLAPTRPVILLDQRGNGRTGDVPGPITYERLGDDAAAVLEAAGVRRADVLGFSMGGGAAIQLAIRHPALVNKLVAISASYNANGMYPPQGGGPLKITPSMFDGTGVRRSFDRLAPRPNTFPILVGKMNALEAAPQDWPVARVRGIAARTMIVIGDHDIIRPEHAVDMFKLRGGGDTALSATGTLTKAPPARLAILPGSAHLNVLAQPGLIAELVLPFLDDATPPVPAGFF